MGGQPGADLELLRADGADELVSGAV